MSNSIINLKANQHNQEWLRRRLESVLIEAQEKGINNFEISRTFLLTAFDVNQSFAPTENAGIIVALRIFSECLLNYELTKDLVDKDKGLTESKQSSRPVH